MSISLWDIVCLGQYFICKRPFTQRVSKNFVDKEMPTCFAVADKYMEEREAWLYSKHAPVNVYAKPREKDVEPIEPWKVDPAYWEEKHEP